MWRCHRMKGTELGMEEAVTRKVEEEVMLDWVLEGGGALKSCLTGQYVVAFHCTTAKDQRRSEM